MLLQHTPGRRSSYNHRLTSRRAIQVLSVGNQPNATPPKQWPWSIPLAIIFLVLAAVAALNDLEIVMDWSELNKAIYGMPMFKGLWIALMMLTWLAALPSFLLCAYGVAGGDPAKLVRRALEALIKRGGGE